MHFVFVSKKLCSPTFTVFLESVTLPRCLRVKFVVEQRLARPTVDREVSGSSEHVSGGSSVPSIDCDDEASR